MEQNVYLQYENRDNVEIISRFVLYSLVIFSFLEYFFFPQLENIYGCLTFFIGWLFLYYFVLKIKGFNRNKCLFPYLGLLGLGISFFYMPLFVTLLEYKPLTFRFQNPYLTFNNQLLNLIMLIAAYRLCLSTYNSNNWIQRLWYRLGYFIPPTDKQMWVMGGVGFVAFAFLTSLQGGDGGKIENLGFVGQLCGVLKLFSTLPFILLFKDLYGGDSSREPNKFLLICFFCLYVVLGLATGKRASALAPMLTMIGCFFVPVFTKNKNVFSSFNLSLIVIVVFFVMGPGANIAMSMAIGRDNSGQTNSSDTFDNIMKVYQDKERLHRLYQMSISSRDNMGNNIYGWSEYYVDNILLDRFCNIRVCDATLFYANRLGFDNPKMHEYMTNRLIFLLPSPVIKILGLQVNKFDNKYSPGDLLSTEALGLRQQYMGFRVAGDTGIGLYLWGYKYYIFAFFLYYALFYFLSSKVLIKQDGSVIIPIVELIAVWGVFLTFNNSTGIVRVISTLLRLGWQTIFVYCLVFFVVRKFIR